MGKYKDQLVSLSLVLLLVLINSVYFYLNNPQRGVHSLVTDLDKSVPFVSLFAIPYLIWYPFIALTLIYFYFRYRQTFYKVMSSYAVGMLISYVIYVLFQTTVPRPVLLGSDFLTRLVGLIYSYDNPFNCFPSLHVLTSYLLIKGIRESKPKIAVDTVIIIGIATLIILSTQFIKQHVVLDVVFAVLLGDGVYKLVGIFNQRSILWAKKQFWWLMTKRKLEI